MRIRMIVPLAIVYLIMMGTNTKACIPDDSEPSYYTLFIQQIVMDPQYGLFLNNSEYSSYLQVHNAQLDNIIDWQHYLGISYNEAYQLVYKTNIDGIRKSKLLLKHSEAKDYLLYAKFLEPYMNIAFDPYSSTWTYRDSTSVESIDNLDYEEANSTLIKMWNASTQPQIKIRYGYQLVRLAHYTKHYKEALWNFNTYVESLHIKPAIYYYALDQKAGAEHKLSDFNQANKDFLQVFVNSTSLKENAYQSMHFTNTNFQELLNSCNSDQERNDIYLLLGYSSFSNPLALIRKIVNNTPDAPQAKVLMARAINDLEKNYLVNIRYERVDASKLGNKQYPLAPTPAVVANYNQVTAFVKSMCERDDVKDKNFWNLTASYISFLGKKFDESTHYLAEVNSKDSLYTKMIYQLQGLNYICSQDSITPDVEEQFATKYLSFFADKSDYEEYLTYRSLCRDVVANKYYLHGDYAKSFLMTNSLVDLSLFPDSSLISRLELFNDKSSKNKWEEHLQAQSYPRQLSETVADVEQNRYDYFNYVEGCSNLLQGKLREASLCFDRLEDNFRYINSGDDNDNWGGFRNIAMNVFGFNTMECFSCNEGDVMKVEYLDKFPYIKDSMNMQDLAHALIKLNTVYEDKSDSKSPIAGYLLGNFFYNVSSTGYYSRLLKFEGYSGGHGELDTTSPPIYNDIFFKNYAMYYHHTNSVSIAQNYLENSWQWAQEKNMSYEFRAKCVFALSKCELEQFYMKDKHYGKEADGILISNNQYFSYLEQYKNTQFYKDVRSYCKYFNYYVEND